MKKNKTTVSVAIPAFNEELSIAKVIKQILSQNQKSFRLKSIIVYSDNSQDGTEEIVRRLRKKNPVIKLKTDNNRLGKYLRMSQAFQDCKTDVLVVLDADIVLVGRLFLENLVNEVVKDSKANMVSAHQVFIKPDGLIARAIYSHFMLWNYIRFSLPDLNVAQNFYGSATAFRGSFARSIKIPKNISDPHLYIYLSAARKNGFRYSKKATMRQWPIATLNDLNKLLRRSLGKKDERLEKLFNINTEDIYAIPNRYKIIGILKSIAHEPIYTFFALLLVVYTKYQLRIIEADENAVWEIATSTKRTGN